MIYKLFILIFFFYQLSFSLSSKLTNTQFILHTRSEARIFRKTNPIFSNNESPVFDVAKKTVFLVHGFTDSENRSALTLIRKEILKKEDVNVIFVDWEEDAKGPNYLQAVDNVRFIAADIAQFIRAKGINPMKVHCIGHSLGAHVCGYTGKIFKLKRISGLDPAGPRFGWSSPAQRLDKTDAEFVDVIHTDGNLGLQKSIGHMDFYPNGGTSQPNCEIQTVIPGIFGQELSPVDMVACNHIRVIYLYAETINSECMFKSAICSDWDTFVKRKCTCSLQGCAYMGYKADLNIHGGDFFLYTNGKSNYCIA